MQQRDYVTELFDKKKCFEISAKNLIKKNNIVNVIEPRIEPETSLTNFKFYKFIIMKGSRFFSSYVFQLDFI
jgi:hypothetical protein